MPTIKTALAAAKNHLREARIASYALDAELLLADVLGVPRENVIFYPDMPLPAEVEVRFQSAVERRLKREPMAHILGRREFFGRMFKVSRDTLDPRPDSETLIEAVLGHYKNRSQPLKILDLGTGTGCLLLTLLAEFPEARGMGIDLSPAALEIAKYNARELGLEKRVHFQLNSWAEGITETFDVVITNPPYIKETDLALLEPEVARYEPYMALVGGKDGLACYRELIPDIARLLHKKGMAVLEIGQGQEDDVSHLLRSHRLEAVGSCRDLAGITRCIIAKNN